MRRALYAALLLFLMVPVGAARAAEACRLALALGLDVSGSVDGREYRLQMDGLAAALMAPEVKQALFALPHAPVSLAIYEWGGPGQQRLLLDWIEITAPDQLDRIATQLRATSGSYSDPSTGIGAAIIYGADLLAQKQECWQRTLDISGDGPANIGLDPSLIPEAKLAGITINGLVVAPNSRANTTKNLRNVKTLLQYYQSSIIRGPGAFVETAAQFDDFEVAMTRKLTREVQGIIVSQTRAFPLPLGAPLR